MAKNQGPRVNKKLWRAVQSKPYTFEELVGYYRAIYRAYRSLVASKPDAIIVPLRGALPLIRSVQFFASLEHKSRFLSRIYYSRTGQLLASTKERVFEKTVRDEVKAIPESQKLQEFGGILERVRIHSTSKVPHIILFDEAFGGGSISKSYELIEKAAAGKGMAIRLDAMAIASGERARTSSAYKHLLSLKRLKEFEVPRLFTLDNPRFLQPLIEREASKTLRNVTWHASRVLPKPVKRVLRTHFEKLAAKRPALGMSKKALDGRMMLLQDLSSLYGRQGKAGTISRLPLHSQKKALTKQAKRKK